MREANKALRKQIEKSGIKQWQIADALGVADSTFTRWLRHELPEERKNEVLRVIEEVKQHESNNPRS